MRVGDSILHEHCLRCFTCGNFLTESCFSKFGQYYCRQDFYSLFGPRCAGCQLVFTETEKVRKIDQSFFHGHCFKCKVCSKDLSEAEKVGTDANGNLLCESDFLKYHCEEDNGASTVLDDCDAEKKTDELNLPNRDSNEANSEEEHDLNKEVIDDPKNKRKRGPKTTIKPHQLEILKNCFDQNPKPTPKVFEELSKDTGLSKRVIQVWFQNKRSKSKRINKMQNLINMGQSFGSPIPGLGFPAHPGWDRGDHPLLPCDLPPDFQGGPGPGYPMGYPEQFYGEENMSNLSFNTNVHFSPGSCYPSPPSQSSDFPPGPPGPPFPPPPSLASFPSPGMEGPYNTD